MPRKLFHMVLMAAVLLWTTPLLADGDFYVIAGGGGVGTKITSAPYTISAPGAGMVRNFGAHFEQKIG